MLNDVSNFTTIMLELHWIEGALVGLAILTGLGWFMK